MYDLYIKFELMALLGTMGFFKCGFSAWERNAFCENFVGR